MDYDETNINVSSKEFHITILFSLDVYSLCVAYPEPLADKLYSETKKFLEEHVDSLLIKVSRQSLAILSQKYHQEILFGFV